MVTDWSGPAVTYKRENVLSVSRFPSIPHTHLALKTQVAEFAPKEADRRLLPFRPFTFDRQLWWVRWETRTYGSDPSGKCVDMIPIAANQAARRQRSVTQFACLAEGSTLPRPFSPTAMSNSRDSLQMESLPAFPVFQGENPGRPKSPFGRRGWPAALSCHPTYPRVEDRNPPRRKQSGQHHPS
jgi:hypothetical protein